MLDWNLRFIQIIYCKTRLNYAKLWMIANIWGDLNPDDWVGYTETVINTVISYSK